MSTFKRTKNGINNLRLFYNVNYIVYLEGGSTSYNKTEVYKNSFNGDTEDISFWSKLFEKYKANQKFKFRSVGSKVTLKEIAKDLIDGSVKHVYLAMDNEFDEVLNKRIVHPNIFYTYGYSYENDVWNDTTIIDIINDLTAVKVDEKYINNGFRKFKYNIKLGVFADGYLFSKNKSFFHRKKGHLFCIDCNVNAFPSVKINEINNLLITKSLNHNTVRNFAYRKKLNPIKHCFGHLLADFCCQIVSHYLKVKHGFTNLKKEIIYRLAINKFFQNQYNNSDIEAYYKSQFSISGRNVV
ncbi:hypothetical protein [Chryseobacterium caseinilyticum]|uniref:DUF4435 domain-containing protein n=1 Tax=Chryseobacterium caseinilyticum TaxID=2771428 RepID=A0ABR8ZBA0_9FLAO|nr:hypothetical protein [Chryseobacterium caseinilyticum]MBD8082609.1 hypothetical protein [Chryseobacterium caseinilyticum]